MVSIKVPEIIANSKYVSSSGHTDSTVCFTVGAMFFARLCLLIPNMAVDAVAWSCWTKLTASVFVIFTFISTFFVKVWAAYTFWLGSNIRMTRMKWSTYIKNWLNIHLKYKANILHIYIICWDEWSCVVLYDSILIVFGHFCTHVLGVILLKYLTSFLVSGFILGIFFSFFCFFGSAAYESLCPAT